jgi:hypothetical protein
MARSPSSDENDSPSRGSEHKGPPESQEPASRVRLPRVAGPRPGPLPPKAEAESELENRRMRPPRAPQPGPPKPAREPEAEPEPRYAAASGPPEGRIYAGGSPKVTIARADVDSDEDRVVAFRRQLALAAELFVKLSPLQRFRLANLDTLVAQFVSLIGFVTWGSMLPLKHVAAVFGVSPAYAQSNGPPAVLDPRPYIQMAIFAALFVIFLLSIWVNYFGRNPDSAQRADTVAKALLGFFIGASSNYLGVTLKG